MSLPATSTTAAMTLHDFDLIVLGAGSGGVAASRRAALHGAKVALIEAGRVGGTCVLRGCVPKKLLMYAASYGDAMAEAAGYGWQMPADAPAFEMARWQQAKTAETARLEGVYRANLAQSGVTLVEGHGRFVDAHTIAVGPPQSAPGRRQADWAPSGGSENGHEAVSARLTSLREVKARSAGQSQRSERGGRIITARHIVIATGASPVRDSITGIGACATSDDLLDLSALPPRAAIVGGGYIAVEFASMFARLGVKVNLLYRNRLPLRGFDDDLRTRLAAALQQAGITLMPGQAPRQIAGQPGSWRLELPDGEPLHAPWALNATGRHPNTAGLGLAEVGIATDAAGAVQVDARCHSTVPHVLAIGDVTNRRNLTPVAIAEGRAVADRLFGGRADARVDLGRVTTAVFSLPPIATIGPTEAELAAAGTKLRVYAADFKPMRHAFTGRADRCYMKLLVDDASDRVLAVHMIGADAPEIVQSLAVALSAGATKAHFDATLAVHPTMAEEFVLMREPVRRLS